MDLVWGRGWISYKIYERVVDLIKVRVCRKNQGLDKSTCIDLIQQDFIYSVFSISHVWIGLDKLDSFLVIA